MCKIKSAIILKNKIYFPYNENSHSNMLENLKIKDDYLNASKKFVRVEIVPIDNYIFNHNLENWKLQLDQDIIPDWFDKEKTEKECKVLLKKWFNECFVINKEVDYLDSGNYYIQNSKINKLKNNVVIEQLFSSTVNKMNGSSTVNEMNGSSTVNKMYGSSTVNEMYGSSTVNEMNGSSTVNKMYDSSTINEMYDSSTVNKMYGSSTVNEMYGSSTVNKMYGSSTVNKMYDSSTVNEMHDSSTVNEMHDSSQVTIPRYSICSIENIKQYQNNAIVKVYNDDLKIYTKANWNIVK